MVPLRLPPKSIVLSLYSMRYWSGSAWVGRKIAPPVLSGTLRTAALVPPTVAVVIDGGASSTPSLLKSRAGREAVSQPFWPTVNSLRYVLNELNWVVQAGP